MHQWFMPLGTGLCTTVVDSIGIILKTFKKKVHLNCMCLPCAQAFPRVHARVQLVPSLHHVGLRVGTQVRVLAAGPFSSFFFGF